MLSNSVISDELYPIYQLHSNSVSANKYHRFIFQFFIGKKALIKRGRNLVLKIYIIGCFIPEIKI